jgi:hypothetical protein
MYTVEEFFKYMKADNIEGVMGVIKNVKMINEKSSEK